MRILALALGVVASVVASLVLARHGIEPVRPPIDRWIVDFALQLICVLAVFAAALVIAAPLVGGILLLLSAILWGAAAFSLQGTLFAVIAPPVLLVIGAAVAIFAFIRRPVDRPVPRLELASSAEPLPEPVTASAMFDAEPEPHAEPVPDLPPLPGYEPPEDLRPAMEENWRPGKRRPPPPRQEPVFREPDDIDDEPEESGFARFIRSVSGVLSFGLYAALAGAAVLIYVNIRAEEASPGRVAEIAPASTSSAAVPASSSSAASSSATSSVLAPVQQASVPASPVLTSDAASSDVTLRQVGPGTIFAAPEAAASSASFEPVASSSLEPLSSSELLASASSSETPVQLQPENLLDPGVPTIPEEPSSSAASEPAVAPSGGVMPFTMPAQMAAAREQPSPGPSAVAASPPPQDTTGL